MIITEYHGPFGFQGIIEVPDGSLRKVTTDFKEALISPVFMGLCVPKGGRIEAYAMDTDPGCPNCGEVGGKPLDFEERDRENGYWHRVPCCSLCHGERNE